MGGRRGLYPEGVSDESPLVESPDGALRGYIPADDCSLVRLTKREQSIGSERAVAV